MHMSSICFLLAFFYIASFVDATDLVWADPQAAQATFLGSAAQSSTNNQLFVVNGKNQLGAVWWREGLLANISFYTSFTFTCSKESLVQPGAGFAFVFSSSRDVKGNNNKLMGYDFPSNVAIEFNPFAYSETASNFNRIRVVKTSKGGNADVVSSFTNLPFDICDGTSKTFTAIYDVRTFTLTVTEQSQKYTFSVKNFKLQPFIGTDFMYIGFTASTTQTLSLKLQATAVQYRESVQVILASPNVMVASQSGFITVTGKSFTSGSQCVFTPVDSRFQVQKTLSTLYVSSTQIMCFPPTLDAPEYILKVTSSDTQLYQGHTGVNFYIAQGVPALSNIRQVETSANWTILAWDISSNATISTAVLYTQGTSSRNIDTTARHYNFSRLVANPAAVSFAFQTRIGSSTSQSVTFSASFVEVDNFNVFAVQVSSDSISLVWNSTVGSATAKSFIVNYKETHNKLSHWTAIPLKNTAGTYQLAKLESGAFYSTYVQAVFDHSKAILSTPIIEVKTMPGCGDGLCSLSEDCLICSVDCWCNLAGWKSSTVDATTGEAVDEPTIEAKVSSFECPSTDNIQYLSSYISGGMYVFSFSTTGEDEVALQFSVDGTPLMGSLHVFQSLSTPTLVKFVAYGARTPVSIAYRSKSGSCSLDVQWDEGKSHGDITAAVKPYVTAKFSSSVCGDGSCHADEDESNCPLDCTLFGCGDGKCEHPYENVTSCYTDCFGVELNENCTFITPQSNLQQGVIVNDDTLGDLISGQLLYGIPGVDHMAHGFDIFQGLEAISPAFQFTYCPANTGNGVLQDTYRGMMYQIPAQLAADAYPLCTFNSEATSFASSSEYAESLAESTNIQGSFGVSGGGFGVKVAAKFAFSQEKSSSAASSVQQARSGSMTVVEAHCYTSRLAFAGTHNLHPNFRMDLSNALNSTNTTDSFVDLLVKYGSHYYKETYMGGKLSMIFSTTQQSGSSSSQQSTQQMSSASFSASVSGWGQSVDASGAYSASVNQDSTAQTSFEGSTSKTSIITYGGAPGSFGPQGGEATSAPTNWGDWADSVDLLPVPVVYTLGRIYDVLDPKFQQFWQEAEMIYYEQYASSLAQGGVTLMNTYMIEIVTPPYWPGAPSDLLYYEFNINGDIASSETFALTNDTGNPSGSSDFNRLSNAETVHRIWVDQRIVGDFTNLTLTQVGSSANFLSQFQNATIRLVDHSSATEYDLNTAAGQVSGDSITFGISPVTYTTPTYIINSQFAYSGTAFNASYRLALVGTVGTAEYISVNLLGDILQNIYSPNPGYIYEAPVIMQITNPQSIGVILSMSFEVIGVSENSSLNISLYYMRVAAYDIPQQPNKVYTLDPLLSTKAVSPLVAVISGSSNYGISSDMALVTPGTYDCGFLC